MFSSCNYEICHCISIKLLLFLVRIWKSARLCIFHIKELARCMQTGHLYSEYAIIVASFGDTIKRNVSIYPYIHTITFSHCDFRYMYKREHSVSEQTGCRVSQYKTHIENDQKVMKINVGKHRETDYTGVPLDRFYCINVSAIRSLYNYFYL